MQIKSPLTGSDKIKKIQEISTDFIADQYQEQLGVDVKKYFKDIKTLALYECVDSGYRFYYPFNITGDGKFYEDLQKHPWYYMDWKWEHEEASRECAGAKSILEIGSAQGEFLEKMQGRGIDCTGLELNGYAAQKGREKGIRILEESIEEHAHTNKERYDIVCSFQVMEHVPAIKEFIQAAVDTLKPGGKLVMSVPNNRSIVFTTTNNIVLNMPPHHMGLWDTDSLISLQRFFPLRVEKIYTEPLQSYHIHFAKKVAEKNFEEKLYRKHLAHLPFIKMLGTRFINMDMHAIAPYIIGHSIMVVYTKV